MPLSRAARTELLACARQSIAAALEAGALVPWPDCAAAPELLAPRSSFVTLRIAKRLRGCCGTLHAAHPLAQDVWRNAWAAAFNDPRFTSLMREEWARVDLHVSVLSPPVPLGVANERQLIDSLEPHVDGLILELGAARATFLPAVWEQIPDPRRFVQQLKLKAGWSADFWSPQIRVSRYAVEEVSEQETIASPHEPQQ